MLLDLKLASMIIDISYIHY